jgi:hypothetical protein
LVCTYQFWKTLPILSINNAGMCHLSICKHGRTYEICVPTLFRL